MLVLEPQKTKFYYLKYFYVIVTCNEIWISETLSVNPSCITYKK